MRLLIAAFAVLIGIDALIFGPFMTLLGVAVAALGALPVIAAVEARRMRRDPSYHCWPSITTCRLCTRRVFAWQRKQRRSLAVHVDNPHCVDVGISGSCIVHLGCPGTPTADASIRISSRSHAA
ncbi:MAG: hypothetical protein Q8R16_02965 [bacterium]|nr:hypothetical protein [bacterium]